MMGRWKPVKGPLLDACNVLLSSYMPSISDGVYSVKKPVTVAKAIPVDLGPMQPLKITM